MYDLYYDDHKPLQQRIEDNEKEMLQHIKKYISKHRNAPSVRDLTRVMGFGSTSTTYAYLKRLKAKNIIDWTPQTHRSIKLITKKERITL